MLVGLLGRGIQLSRTPAMHEAEGRAQGLSYVYRLLDTDTMGDDCPALADIVAFAEHFGFTGFNVTFPYKQEIIPLLDELSEAAEALGSVNTVVLRRRPAHRPQHRHVGLQGEFPPRAWPARGATACCCSAPAARGRRWPMRCWTAASSKLLVDRRRRDRRPPRLRRGLRSRFGARAVEVASDLAAAAARADGIVNATPVGMAKLPGMPLDCRAAAARVLGRRHRLFSAGDRAARGGAQARLPHAERRRHGRLPGGAGLRTVHRHVRPTSIG